MQSCAVARQLPNSGWVVIWQVHGGHQAVTGSHCAVGRHTTWGCVTATRGAGRAHVPVLKVSKSRKRFLVLSILPKYEKKNILTVLKIIFSRFLFVFWKN